VAKSNPSYDKQTDFGAFLGDPVFLEKVLFALIQGHPDHPQRNLRTRLNTAMMALVNRKSALDPLPGDTYYRAVKYVELQLLLDDLPAPLRKGIFGPGAGRRETRAQLVKEAQEIFHPGEIHSENHRKRIDEIVSGHYHKKQLLRAAKGKGPAHLEALRLAIDEAMRNANDVKSLEAVAERMTGAMRSLRRIKEEFAKQGITLDIDGL
jgi:hypothetical protein